MRKQRDHLKIRGGSSSACSGSGINLEQSFIAENDEALLAEGYFKNYRGRKAHKPGRDRFSHGRQDHAQDRKINPLGPDGKPLTCRCCGSYRHFFADCQHNKEVMDEHVCEAGARDENILL